MTICSKCGNELTGNEPVCPKCGEPVNQQYNENNNSQIGYTQLGAQQQNYNAFQNQPNQKPVIQTGGYMAWSIVSIFLSLIFGILALVYVNKAKGAATQEEAEKALNTCKVFNIIATVIGVLQIFYVIAQIGRM